MRCLEIIPEYILLLAIFHIAFFWKFYTSWRHCTSEVASNYWPQWLWQGRHPTSLTDKIYYLFPACIPFLSMFYFPSKMMALIGSRITKNTSFKLYSWLILIHYFIGSCIAFVTLKQLFSSDVLALFGALSLTYNAYNIKPQTPCQAFTSCWLMGILLPWPWGAVCFGMAILGGYWPIIITVLPITLLNPSCLFGIVLGLPQIIPFLWYFPKSCRAKSLPDPHWGKMPIWRYFFRGMFPENGIHYPEYEFGVGVCLILALFNPSVWWILALIGFIGSQGYINIARIPARWLYLVSYALVFASLNALQALNLGWGVIILQGFLLWKNRDIYPHFPYSQWWRAPNELVYSGKDWPNNTGYMKEEHHHDYFGGFSLAENHKA